jgi:uncharacterized protein YbcI
MLLALIEKETAIPVVSLHTDISVKAGERIIVFTLQRKLPDLA